ncbi:MAG TPA: hypothetical protein VK842_02370 [bacterium]|nr:hypothetical protein [bacterium]
MSRSQALGAAALGLALLGACASAPKRAGGPPPSLVLSALPAPPAQLDPGTIVTVQARTQPATQLAWVSGTVRIMGAPTLAFRPGADGTWSFRTMVPPMTTVPPGLYQIKAWGRTADGQDVKANMAYEVK